MQDAVSEAEYKYAMRRVVSPVAVITARSGTARNGLTATAICSATTEPPTVVVCVNRQARALRLIEESGTFAVNFLSEQQSDLARTFSTHGLEGETRLGSASWTTLKTGVPILASSVSSFDCVLEKSLTHGTHEVLFGRVVAVTSTESNALLYRDGFFRRIAPE
ncbi:flavin reductase family protein [Pseudooceanicola onchidii]|uniref:flavin reductase family protein n=1 Tax=Pseudooceanicola onchidii TaxID=2562279 RepID=UPI00145AF4CB|nr:flavin reductase family protein [Pseudooceanicola onchidii]